MNLKEARQKALDNRENLALRSCWNCNPAHEHLKRGDNLFSCFECGCLYYSGIHLCAKHDDDCGSFSVDDLDAPEDPRPET